MDWRKELSTLFDDIEFFQPAEEKDIRRIERRLGMRLPRELRSLYKSTNGFLAKLDANICWSILENPNNSDLIEENEYIKTNETPPENFDFTKVLFFGDDGADVFWG